MCGIRLYEYDDVCQRVCVELLNDPVGVDWVGRMGDRGVDDNRGPPTDQEPLLPRENRYLEVSRIPSITADSVMPQDLVQRMQGILDEQGFMIIPTSTGGQEYKTNTGLKDGTWWDNKCFLAVFLKAREVCNEAAELDRFSNRLSGIMDEFSAGALEPSFLQEFLSGTHSLGASVGVLQELCKEARERNKDLSKWDLLTEETKAAMTRALKKQVKEYAKRDTMANETIIAMVVAYFRMPVAIVSSCGKKTQVFQLYKLPSGAKFCFEDSTLTIPMVHYEAESHFDLIVNIVPRRAPPVGDLPTGDFTYLYTNVMTTGYMEEGTRHLTGCRVTIIGRRCTTM